jgi:hypothetical protein
VRPPYPKTGAGSTERPAEASLGASALSLAAAKNSEFADSYIASSADAVGRAGAATFNGKDFARLGVRLADL